VTRGVELFVSALVAAPESPLVLARLATEERRSEATTRQD